MCVVSQAHASGSTINDGLVVIVLAYGRDVVTRSNDSVSDSIFFFALFICLIAFREYLGTTFVVTNRNIALHDVKGHLAIHALVRWARHKCPDANIARAATTAWSYLDLLETKFLFINARTVIDDASHFGTVPFSTLNMFHSQRPEKIKYFSRFATMGPLLGACDVQAIVVYSWRVSTFFHQINMKEAKKKIFFSSFASCLAMGVLL